MASKSIQVMALYRCTRFEVEFLKRFFRPDFTDRSSLLPREPHEILKRIRTRNSYIQIACKNDCAVNDGSW